MTQEGKYQKRPLPACCNQDAENQRENFERGYGKDDISIKESDV